MRWYVDLIDVLFRALIGVTDLENEPMGTDVMSVEEVRVALGMSRNGVYEAIARNAIPSIRIGRRIMVPRAAYSKMLDAATDKMAKAG